MQTITILLALVASVSAQQATANAVVGVDFSGTGDLSVTAQAQAGVDGAPVAPYPTWPHGGPPPPGNGSDYPGCTSTYTHPGTSTITAITTSTYCPVCDEAKNKGLVYTTTYETVYAQVCPTGIQSVTYLIEQVCTGTTEIDTATCPPGFVETTTVCTACKGQPTLTVTVPCDTCHQTPVATATHVVAVSTAAGVTTVPYVPKGTGSPAVPVPVSPPSVVPFLSGASSMSSELLTAGACIGSMALAMLLL